MQDLLRKVSVLDYEKFRKLAIQRCGWTVDQWNDRRTGRTKLKESERYVLTDIINNEL